jgi:hypothetical protein
MKGYGSEYKDKIMSESYISSEERIKRVDKEIDERRKRREEFIKKHQNKNKQSLSEDMDNDKPSKVSKDDDEIDELERQIDELTAKSKKTSSIPKQNKLWNEREALIVKVKKIKAQPEIKRLIKELKQAYKSGEITKEQYEEMKDGTEKTLGTDHLHIMRKKKDIKEKYEKYGDRIGKINIALQNYAGSNPKNFNQQLYTEINNLIAKFDIDEAEAKLKELIKPPKTIKPPKIIKDKNIMKARSDIKNNDGKISIDTEMNIKKGLEPKVKRALKKSVIGELDKKIIGSGIRKIEFELSSDSSSDDDNDIGNGIKGGLVYGYYKPKNPVQPKHILVPNIKYQKKP